MAVQAAVRVHLPAGDPGEVPVAQPLCRGGLATAAICNYIICTIFKLNYFVLLITGGETPTRRFSSSMLMMKT